MDPEVLAELNDRRIRRVMNAKGDILLVADVWSRGGWRPLLHSPDQDQWRQVFKRWVAND